MLYDNGAFNAIPQGNNVQKIKEEFDAKILTIAGSINPNTDQLVMLNKRAIMEMMSVMDKYRTNNSNSNSNSNHGNNNNMPYNTADLAQQRQKAFENELKQKQNDFETFNAKPVPDKIDFSDQLDKPIGSEMDKILAEQIALREKQLNLVLGSQDKAAASKWIGSIDSAGVVEGVLPTVAEVTKIRIGENVSLQIQDKSQDNPRKKVNFIEPSRERQEYNSAEDFMHLLKKTPPSEQREDQQKENNNSMKKMLEEILSNQAKILALLLDKTA